MSRSRYSATASSSSAGIASTSKLGSKRILDPHDGLLVDEIDHSDELGLRRRWAPVWQEGWLPSRSWIMDNTSIEVRANAVHFVDEGHLGHAISIGLAPHCLALGLDPGDGVEDRDGPVENSQCPARPRW